MLYDLNKTVGHPVCKDIRGQVMGRNSQIYYLFGPNLIIAGHGKEALCEAKYRLTKISDGESQVVDNLLCKRKKHFTYRSSR